MLTPDQKEVILRRAGVAVPSFPGHRPDAHARDSEAQHMTDVQRWTEAIDVLYLQYAAARAAKSLRDADEAAHWDRLQRASERSNA
jgi:hypothetical protein